VDWFREADDRMFEVIERVRSLYYFFHGKHQIRNAAGSKGTDLRKESSRPAILSAVSQVAGTLPCRWARKRSNK
jgi:hypothetical protein